MGWHSCHDLPLSRLSTPYMSTGCLMISQIRLLLVVVEPAALAPGLRREDAGWRIRCGMPRLLSAGRGRPASAAPTWISIAASASPGRRPAATALSSTRHITSRSSRDQLGLQAGEHPHGRAFGHHRRGVVGVRRVGGEHELGHHQPAGDRPQLGLQDVDVVAGVEARRPESRIRCRRGVEDRARAEAAEVGGLPGRRRGDAGVGLRRRRTAARRCACRRDACESGRWPIGSRPRRSCCAAASRPGAGSCAPG